MSAKDITPPLSVERLLALVQATFSLEGEWSSQSKEWAILPDGGEWTFSVVFDVTPRVEGRLSFGPLRIVANDVDLSGTLTAQSQASPFVLAIHTYGYAVELGEDHEQAALELIRNLEERSRGRERRS